jgi:predicted alpha/beta superfamily hydrolase
MIKHAKKHLLLKYSLFNTTFMQLIHSLIFSCFLLNSGFSQLDAPKKKVATTPFVLGEICSFQSAILEEERTLNIYFPEGYNVKDSIRYPVIYLLDGSADEDFIHITGLVQFANFEWVDLIPKSIVVGISNIDRRRDFTFPTMIPSDLKLLPTSGHSEKFIAFIENELKPFVSQKCKTTTESTIIGQSLGGLLATEILLKKPSLFENYIIISPSLWWNNGSLLNTHVTPSIQTNLKKKCVYIAVGKEGLTPTEIPHVMEVDANLLVDKLKTIEIPSKQLFFDYLPTENHATIMHQAVLNAFIQLHEMKKLD